MTPMMVAPASIARRHSSVLWTTTTAASRWSRAAFDSDASAIVSAATIRRWRQHPPPALPKLILIDREVFAQ